MTEEVTTKVANTKQMVALAKAFNQSKSKVASINGEIGERIAKAVENGNLHAKAFKFNCALARMFEKDDLKAREFWRCLILYHEEFEKAGLFGEQHVGDIDELARKAEQDEHDAEAAQAEANGKAIMEGIGPLPEEDKEFDDETSEKPSRRRAKKEPEPVTEEIPGSYRYQ
ncbi:hypothetical protein [Methylosinus sp. Ce-a6]|uniref:hypothetical protein n=1 Tax=Methylosinus sp. Ce-a6 TaxID=2172005 RepID=UPI001357BD1A|nr:hypothetical protein [Methylosinus sp. Ce-a6]